MPNMSSFELWYLTDRYVFVLHFSPIFEAHVEYIDLKSWGWSKFFFLFSKNNISKPLKTKFNNGKFDVCALINVCVHICSYRFLFACF